jgi:23S rRNA pseudouridine1911/1915/1917 synthase
MESSKKELKFIIEMEYAGLRLDKFLVKNIKTYSRNFFQKLIKDKKVLINGKVSDPNYKLKLNDTVKVILDFKTDKHPLSQNINLDIVFENKDILIINKKAGMIVHPAENAKHMKDTLVNALLHSYGFNNLSDINGVLRPGIVHRLDKNTSGLIIIAKNNEIHKYLSTLFKKRLIKKTYLALVKGYLKPESGTIEAPLTKAYHNKTKVYLSSEEEGKRAITHYKVLKYFEVGDIKCSFLKINIETGRTHQIRVHLNAIGHPIIGDDLYGDKRINMFFLKKYLLKRQFLHASELEFTMPNNKKIHVKTDLPQDLKEIINTLK